MKTRISNPFRSAISAIIATITLGGFAAPSVFAVSYYWDNDGATAGFGTAAGTWAAPTIGDATQGWSEDSAGTTEPVSVTTTTSDTVFFGTSIGLGSGTVTVSGTVDVNNMTIGSASGPITLSGGTVALGGTSPFIRFNNSGNTIGSALTLGASTNVVMGNSAALLQNLNGAIGGTGNLTFTTPNSKFNNANQVINLGAASSYTGNTLITTGNANNRLLVKNNSGAANALPITTVLTLDGGNGAGTGRNLYYDLNGQSQTLAGLKSTARSLRNQRVDNTGAAATLTVDGGGDSSFGGAVTTGTTTARARIQGAISLVKSGVGTFTLAESHTYTGATTINGGKLLGSIPGSCLNSEVIIANAGATFGVEIADNTKSWTCDSFTPSAAGTLEFNFGAIAPSDTVSPLTVTAGSGGTGIADFTAATPTVSIVTDSGVAPGTYPLMTWDSTSGTAPTGANLSMSQLAFGTAADLQVSGTTLNLVITSTAVTIVKANNTNNLNLGTSWVGGTAPTGGEYAKWDSTVTSANTTVLGADLTWAGLVIENPNGLVTIGGANTLTLGAADTDIDMSTTPVNPADLTLNCPLTLGAANVWNVAATRTLTLGGQVSGAFDVTKLGAGTLQLGASDLMPDGVGSGNFSLAGTLDLKGNSDTINGLSGSGVIDNTGLTTSTLTVGANDQTSTFNGILQSSGGAATLNLVKTGTGRLTLGGANTMSGNVTVNVGTLALSNTNPLDNASGITLAGDTTLRPNLANTVVSPPITIGATGTTVTITGHSVNSTTSATQIPVTLGGAISGDGDVVFNGIESTNDYSRINLNAASDYAGSTLITATSEIFNSNIFLALGVENALPATTVVTLDGGDGTGGGRFCELNLNGNNQTLAGLTNVTGRTLRTQRVTSVAAATLTINDSGIRAYSGQITGAISLLKSNTGTWTLSGAKANTGTTTITGGTLALGSSNVLPDATAVSIGGGALAIAAGFTDTVGTLALTSAATINFGDASSKLVFADSSGETWSGSLNLSGSFVSGASLRFGSDNTGLTAGQIASISASGFTGFALDVDGFLTATSTGGFSSWITGTFANGTVPGDKQGPNDDFDNDGISNLVEYAIAGLDPTVSNASVGSFAANVLSFTKREGTSGLTYAIEESTDLGIADDWTEVSGASYVNDAGGISYTLTPGSPVKNFTRLKVMTN